MNFQSVKNIFGGGARLVLASAVATTVLVLPSVSGAQVLEEVIVTARKRDESLQDVPVSVQAFGGDEVQESGIVDVRALAPYTPNFSYTTAAGASDILVMRGLGTIGSGPHFEQAVGQVMNGFFTTRSRLGRSALVDLGQIEVLKGPQGAIIGKNTSLGAINISTNKPTDDFEASVFAGYDFEASEGFEVQNVLSGPISDRIRARSVINYVDKDGWVDNRSTGDSDRRRKDLVARLIVDAELTESLTAEVILQHTDFEHNGKPREVYACNNPTAAATVGFDCVLNGSNQTINIVEGVNNDEPFTLEADMAGLTLSWDFENFTVSSLTGVIEYTIEDSFSSDLKPIENRAIFNSEDYEQFSQEIRLTSTGDQDVDYIIGALYMTADMDFVQNSDFLPAPGPPGSPDVRRHEAATTSTDTLSAFGQFDWHLSDAWTFTLGGRYTSEDRDGAKAQVMKDPYSDNVNIALCGGGFRTCTLNDAGSAVQAIADSIDETNFSYNTALRWEPDADTMYYVSYSTGFKSGGFDLRGGSADPSTFVFDDEESTSIELGGRHTLFDGSARFFWTLFNTNVEDLQLSSNDPATVTQTVINGEATAKGVEFELKWAATDALQLGLVGAYLDATYDEFLAPCYVSQTAAAGCTIDLNSNGAPETQDLSGVTMAYAPEVSLVGSVDYTFAEFANGTELAFGLKAIYYDDQVMMVDNNPNATQESYTKFDASLTLSDVDGDWYVSLVGRNLSDEIIKGFTAGTTACPGGPGPGQASCLVGPIEETKALSLRMQYNF